MSAQLRPMPINEIGFGVVNRALTIGDKKMLRGEELSHGLLAAMPAANRNALIENRIILVYPKGVDVRRPEGAPAPVGRREPSKSVVDYVEDYQFTLDTDEVFEPNESEKAMLVDAIDSFVAQMPVLEPAAVEGAELHIRSKGFQRWDIIHGVIVKTGIESRDDADAFVAAGLQAKAQPDPAENAHTPEGKPETPKKRRASPGKRLPATAPGTDQANGPITE